jgi:hypothetical protein
MYNDESVFYAAVSHILQFGDAASPSGDMHANAGDVDL